MRAVLRNAKSLVWAGAHAIQDKKRKNGGKPCKCRGSRHFYLHEKLQNREGGTVVLWWSGKAELFLTTPQSACADSSPMKGSRRN